MAPSQSREGSSSQSRSAASPPATPALSLRTKYLILYNAVNAYLWHVVLARVLATLVRTRGTSDTYAEVGAFTKWTQTVAVLEILHAALGTPLASPRPLRRP